MTIAVVNPLPAALAHYADELDAVLTAVGERSIRLPSPSVERVAGGSIVARSLRALHWRRAFRATSEDAIVLWPAFGLLDPVTLSRGNARTWLIVHDPVPLRRQLGTSRMAGRLGRPALRRGLTVVVHSEPAQDALAERGWPALQVPHPILPPRAVARPRADMLRVLGQWKPTRSMHALEHLAAVPDWDGRRQISGRGWPTVAGWEVDSRFLSEAELDDRITSSAAVIVPYSRYFQSGIATRCLEGGVPVVGRAHPFLAELYGSQWPGTVIDNNWKGAVERALEVPGDDIRELHERYWTRCVEAWRRLLARVARDP